MTYVIVITGNEGIDRLVWVGEDREEAIRRVQQLRDRLAKVNTRCDELQPNPELFKTEEGVAQYRAAEERMWRTLDAEFGDTWSFTETPNHVCVQGYDPATDKFKCCCADLDVSPSKAMLRW